ncbi:unnamed protein product [Calypogeia fissa]
MGSTTTTAFPAALLRIQAAALTLNPKSSLVRNSFSSTRSSLSPTSTQSITTKFLQPFHSTRRYPNCHSNRTAGPKFRGFSRRRVYSSSSSSSSSSSPSTTSASGLAAMAEDTILKALRLDEGVNEENGSSGTRASRVMEDEERLNEGDEEAIKRGKAVDASGIGPSSSSSGAQGSSLDELRWDHSFVRELPGDSVVGGPVRQVLHSCYSRVAPSAEVKDPQLVSWSGLVAKILDIDPKEFERPEFPLLFSGASLLKGSLPYAQCYGGHQFGVWAGQLGDGRAITLGEILNNNNERWELQLKGAGKTPYSRMADGLAVLRSSVREYLCSEAMHHLGIPTTRALSLVMTGASVERDMFYDGHPKLEPGAIVCRVAPSFLRFGSYQIHAARNKEDLQTVRKLADYAIQHHFPQFEDFPSERQGSEESSPEGTSGSPGSPPDIDVSKNKYAAWFTEIAERTALMIAKWQGVGFTHGVMNTDNMSILGLTIDYGPFGFLDAFDPKFTPNTTDLPGRRYCFANQPDIGLWNTVQLANTLHSAELISTKEAQYGLGRYADKFMDEYRELMSQKMGLKEYNKDLLSKLLNNMAIDKVDYTNFFRVLGNVSGSLERSDDSIWVPLKSVLPDLGSERKKIWVEWLRRYIQQLSEEGIPDDERKAAMNKVNPKYILRNYLCQTAIDQAEIGDFTDVEQLLKLMEKPYDEQPGMEKYARLPPAWAYRPGVCMLSCSS